MFPKITEECQCALLPVVWAPCYRCASRPRQRLAALHAAIDELNQRRPANPTLTLVLFLTLLAIRRAPRAPVSVFSRKGPYIFKTYPP